MRIRINPYDPDSIAEAKKMVDNYTNSLEAKMQEILSRLTVLGAQVVEYQYYTSNEDYEVSCITEGNSAMIIAEGSNVMFLEFGTGVYTEDNTEDMDTAGLPPIFGGAWSNSEGRGHFRPDHQYWYYDRKKYAGTLPTHGFYFASKEIKEQAVEIAKKVFKK